MGSFLARRMRLLYDRYLGSDWYEHMDDPEMWARIDLIPDAELWAVRRHLKRKLVIYANGALHVVAFWKGTPGAGIIQRCVDGIYSLTIGFARRFATYKSGNLILRDYERLLKMHQQRILTRPGCFCWESPPGG